MSSRDEEDEDMDGAADNDSKMKAMKAIINYADDQEGEGMKSKSSSESSRVSKEGGLGAATFDDGMGDEDEDKKKSGGGGLGLDKIMGMFK